MPASVLMIVMTFGHLLPSLRQTARIFVLQLARTVADA